MNNIENKDRVIVQKRELTGPKSIQLYVDQLPLIERECRLEERNTSSFIRFLIDRYFAAQNGKPKIGC